MNTLNDLEFKNKRTEKLHKKLLRIDKGNYQKFLNNTLADFFEGGDNGKNDNIKIYFDCFQFIELYSRSNKKRIERIFAKFIDLCQTSDRKYTSLKNTADEIIQKIVDKVDHSFVTLLTDFNIQLTMSLDCIGPNLFKIIFNCWLSDFAKYKYWIYACPNVIKELEVIRKFQKGKNFLNFSKTAGIQRKRIMLRKHTHAIYKEINNYLSSIAPGIFISIYKKIPGTLIASYVVIPEFIVTKHYTVYLEQEQTKFFDSIITFDGSCERFVDNDSGNAFIPLMSDIMAEDDTVMKFFATNDSLPSGMAWVNIVYFLLHNQNMLIEILKNTHYENDIYGKTINIKEFKKKMRKIGPLLELIKSSYGSKIFSFEHHKEQYNKYTMILDEDLIIPFYDEFRGRIDNLLKTMETEIISVKEIYFDNYNEINNKINHQLQLIAIIMALFTFLQAFFQCQGIRDNKKIEDHPPVNGNTSETVIIKQTGK